MVDLHRVADYHLVDLALLCRICTDLYAKTTVSPSRKAHNEFKDTKLSD